MTRMSRAATMGLPLALLLSGCGDREGSIKAALTLAEAVYPGQLELHDSYLQKDNYDVALVMKGDPLTRVRFGIDRDPAQCRVGTHCEQRLRRAYDSGVAAGIKLKALNAAFPACGVPMLGLEGTGRLADFRTVLELDLDPAQQQAGLDRLAPCIAAFRSGLPEDADAQRRALNLRILLPLQGQPTPPVALTLDSKLPSRRADERSYVIVVGADDGGAMASELRLDVHHVLGSGLDKKLAEAARGVLHQDPRGGHVPERSSRWDMKLDPERLDVIRTYVLACSTYERGMGPCQTDVAVRMRYGLGSGEVSEVEVFRDIRDRRGSVVLPELPGR